MFVAPAEFVTFTVTRAGEAGRQWIARLPALVEALCHEWSLVIDGAPMYGGLSVVVPVRQGELPCVLKVGWVDESIAREALALSNWNGNGAVRLFVTQTESSALLLEQLNSARSMV